MYGIVDLVVLALIGWAAWTGWRLGASRFVSALVGLVAGLLVGLRIAGSLLSSALSPVAHVLLALVCALGGALIGSSLGGRVGDAIGRALARARLQLIDRVAGAVARAALAALGCSIVAGLIVAYGPPQWSRLVRGSALLSRPGGPIPVASRLFDSLTGQLRHAGPADVGALIPAAGGAAAPSTATLDRVESGAAASVVMVSADGCGDPAPGSPAVVLGYPGGSPLTATAGVIVQRLPVPNPGFTDGLALHQAYRIAATVRHGNSGSPLLNIRGQVIGVVNALAAHTSDRGYAITLDELRPELAAAGTRKAAVATGNWP